MKNQLGLTRKGNLKMSKHKKRSEVAGCEVIEPKVEIQSTPKAEYVGDFFYAKRIPRPCPQCGKLKTSVGGKAAALIRSGKDVVYFRCKVCGHTWKVAVRNPDLE